ncbi:MAG: hypothetical protein IJY04_01280 [Clostridia bacterium]|nr:hypothetical protein [Clostridia bacterium]
MSGLFEPRGTQFYNGKYFEKYPTIENAEKGIRFTYERISDERSAFSFPVRNLVSREKKTGISTTAPIKWRVGSYILTQDGRLWVIENWSEDEPINPQTAFFLRRNLESTAIFLTEVDNPLRLTV